MKQNIMIAGPFGELQGVLHLCDLEENRGKVLVMAHGFRGSMEGGGRAAKLAEEISETICSVVRFNFSWCTCLSNQVAELKCVLDFVRNTLEPEKLFLLGRSFGGATCIITACGDIEIVREAADKLAIGKDKNPAVSWHARKTYCPDGLVLWSAPNSLKKTFIEVLGEEQFTNALQGKSVLLADERGHDEIPAAFVKDLLKYNIAELLKRWKNGPLLIIHGEKDCIVSPNQAKENFDLAGGDKQLHYMEGDNHHLDLRFQEAGELVKTWLKENI
ncbi:MAG: alpha/beta hydrolase [Acidaminococcaceae bacterium]|nr:alpha/beta hydrolase [Acidaminococcaceae bacterium]